MKQGFMVRSFRYERAEGKPRLWILDQCRLPFETKERLCESPEEVAKAISDMAVRGAPAIGIVAAYAYVMGIFLGRESQALKALLLASRPTAVNLQWALERMGKVYEEASQYDGLLERLEKEATDIEKEDLALNHAIGAHGAALIPKGARILTHCNTGSLATAGWGTALGMIRSAFEKDKTLEVYATETRPYLQGSRLTSWELLEEGIPVTLIVDAAAAAVMAEKSIDLVVIGADRIARNGDTANKIGSYALAVLARHHGIPFYVAAPYSSLDGRISNGKAIPIEERNPHEVRAIMGTVTAPSTVPVYNPAFDLTPAELITAIVTDKGVFYPPYEDAFG